jgi:hypothetical protein
MKTRTLFLTAMAVLLAGFLLAGCGDNSSPSAESLRIGAPPSKTVYSIGETLDLAGLSVVCRYSDGAESALAVSASDVKGFDSSATVQDQVLTVSKSGLTAQFTVHVIGELVGEWLNDKSQVAFTLNGDFTGSTAWMRGGTWHLEGCTLYMTYTEQYNEETGFFDDLGETRYIHWDWAVIGGKLYISSPFVRVGTGATLIGTFEQIVWDGSYPKYRATISDTGAVSMSIFPLAASTSFNTQTGTGTWSETATGSLTASIATPLPIPAAGTVEHFTVSSSTYPALLPDGDNTIVWFTADRYGVNTPGWTRD